KFLYSGCNGVYMLLNIPCNFHLFLSLALQTPPSTTHQHSFYHICFSTTSILVARHCADAFYVVAFPDDLVFLIHCHSIPFRFFHSIPPFSTISTALSFLMYLPGYSGCVTHNSISPFNSSMTFSLSKAAGILLITLAISPMLNSA